MTVTVNPGPIAVAPFLEVLRVFPWDILLGLTQVVTMFVAVYACILARQQLIPLRKDIERLATAERRGQTLRTELVAPSEAVLICGFDARFTNNDWYNILSTPVAPATLKLSLDRSQKAFWDALQTQPSPFPSRSVLIMSFVLIAELLQKKLIDPIPEGDLEFARMMAVRAEAHGQTYDEPSVKLARYLCSDVEGTVGALPLWVNSHGRMIPDPQLFDELGRIGNVSSLESLFRRDDADKILKEAGVQGYNLTFEFWAHLAYCGCRLFRTRATDPRAFYSDVLTCSEELERFATAVADLATRLQFSSRTREAFQSAGDRHDIKEKNLFDIGHNADARVIRESLSLWKPVFSSELLWKASRRRAEPAVRLMEETDFRPPYYRHKNTRDWSYLSTIGGYGLALPKGAASDPECVKAIKYLFLANPCLMHPYVSDMLGYEPTDQEVSDFAERHARPRWPFWQPASKELSACLYDLLMSLDRTGGRKPAEFRSDAIARVIGSRNRIAMMFDAIRVLASAQEPSWMFEF